MEGDKRARERESERWGEAGMRGEGEGGGGGEGDLLVLMLTRLRSGNALGSNGSTALAACLGKLTTLQTLGLRCRENGPAN